ncbi:hypothetical protein GDO78_013421 [Eleutherodactylus coqui]|uniref:Rac/Cdc42 guanine nucleotide exchange factor (GEF) 6 n=1 Tax=Eleutherodactylus coqui TaxID=57060 RepID=A0A8J6K2C9_ELECQ|nr:hypothetical protein GDO78_013421 [Eleutherodactylus coqui]
MNPEEQTVTWLISLGVLNSPKKNICDPQDFLKSSLKDGVVLCRLMTRLLPGSVDRFVAEPKSEADCLENIREFLKACSSLRVELFEAHDLYTGENFCKILNTLTAVNRATEEEALKRPCSRTSSQSHSFTASSQMNMQGADSSTRVLRRQSKPTDMTGNGSVQLIVKAKFSFKQQNEDELSFSKGDTIHVIKVVDGGWWEGMLNGKTGWFPSNYVKECKANDKPLSPKGLKGCDSAQLTKNYYTAVLQNILETERSYAKELQLLLTTYLRPLQTYDKLPENHQKVGGCFLTLLNQFKSLYLTYCSNHPIAVNVLTQHSDELEKFMEGQGTTSPGVLMLTTSLSKPFMRLEKYVTLLQELERHMEEAHPDHKDVLRVTASFKTLVAQCQDIRKRKQLELQILSEPIQCWEGEDIKTLGSAVYMSQVMVQCGASEFTDRKNPPPSHHTISVLPRGPLEPPKIYKTWTLSCLRPAPPLRPSAALGYKEESSKSPKNVKKFLPKRKPERKASDDDSAFRKSMLLLFYDCSLLHQNTVCGPAAVLLNHGNRKDSAPQVMLLEDESLIIDDMRSNGQTAPEEKSLVDTVYALRDEVKELKQENKRMKQSLDEEQKSRKELEKLVRKMLKQTSETTRDDPSH